VVICSFCPPEVAFLWEVYVIQWHKCMYPEWWCILSGGVSVVVVYPEWWCILSGGVLLSIALYGWVGRVGML